MAAPLVNPPMPLLTPIPGGFLHGKVVRIQAALSHSAQRFAINLQCGPNTNPRDDLALHINARLMERVLVRNSLIMGQWGQEDRHSPSFPFLPGQGFEIVILADSHHYKIAVNGQHFAEFHCRTPMERVSYLSADGDMMITMITFEGGSLPGHMPGHTPMAPGMGYGAPQPGMNPYPTQPYPMQPGMPMPGMNPPGMYPSQPGMAGYPASGYPAAGYPPTSYAHLSPKSAKKAAKHQRKQQKKAMKYGLGAAGLGVGAYALHKGMKHGHHGFHGHSSSSSSSSSEEE